MKNLFKMVVAVGLIAGLALPVLAELPENTPENSFQERIVNAYEKSADLISKGLREVRETLVTDGALIAYEATDSLVDGQVLLDQAVAWSAMYNTILAEDVVRFKKLKEILLRKQQLINELVGVVGAKTTDVNAVVRLKREIKSMDKKFNFQIKALKGKVELTPGKPLPKEAEE